MTVRERLILNGCKDSDVVAEIIKNIYPRHLWLWWCVCMFCSRDKTTPEIEFVKGLADAMTLQEVNELRWDYRLAIRTEKTLFMKPNRKRVRSYFKKMTKADINNSATSTDLP
ncbi:MAG: hypothetical protein K9M98_07640 [Cephaloticoccus sp.]|nr:hypothetical protein [Cephaloticoccus sp.]MCF7760363.1 hypothetical protein [Cephaloticoccus sp.]